mgnify:CR=1 FL=1
MADTLKLTTREKRALNMFTRMRIAIPSNIGHSAGNVVAALLVVAVAIDEVSDALREGMPTAGEGI